MITHTTLEALLLPLVFVTVTSPLWALLFWYLSPKQTRKRNLRKRRLS